jgi:hypothetical protein
MMKVIIPNVVMRNVVMLSDMAHLYWRYAKISNVKIPTLPQNIKLQMEEGVTLEAGH